MHVSSDPPATARECYQLRVESMGETLNADQLSNLRDRLLLSVYVYTRMGILDFLCVPQLCVKSNYTRK